MFNSIRTFSFLFGYLPAAAVALKKFKAQKEELSPAEYDALIHTEPQKWATGIMQRTKSRISVSGLENLPEGPVLLVSNHEGNFDIPLILSTIPKPFGFISKKEVEKFPVIPSYMEEMNCVFLDRTDRRSAFKSIAETTEKLKEGHSILIFPEGTRSKGGEFGEFKAGFMRIAKDGGVPIVPIAIHGTADIMEKNNNKIRPADVAIHVLEPVSAARIAETEAKEMILEIRSMVHNKIEEMKQGATTLS